MPVFNAACFLEESLHSVEVQTYSNWQLVIVDDGSTDNSGAICTEFALRYPETCLILSSPKIQSGAGVCRNIGLEKSKGTLIIFLDADDLLSPFCLQQRVKGIGENDMAVFKQFRLEEGKSVTIFNGVAATRKDAIHAFVRMEAPWQTMAPIWRKTVLQKLCGFDETLLYMEDPDIHLRALLDNTIKVAFRYDLSADNYYRVNNMSADKQERFYDNSIKSRIQFLNRILSSPQLVNDDYKKNLRLGYIAFLKNFVLARMQFYKTEIIDVSNKLSNAGVFTTMDKIKLFVIRKIFSSNSSIIKATRLRGFVYKLL